MHIEFPNCHVAVRNSSSVSWELQYGGKAYHYPAASLKTGKPGLAIVPLEVAHFHWGFELDERGGLFRNTSDEYSDGDETAFYSSRANNIPWMWRNKDLVNEVITSEETGEPETDADGKPVTYGKKFFKIKNSFENGITGKLVKAPQVISEEQYNSL